MALAVIIIAGIVAITIAGQFAAKRFLKINVENLEQHQNLVEALLGVVGTLFSVLLGLLVAGSIDSYKMMSQQAVSEGNACANLFRMARGLNEDERKTIRELCRNYAQVCIEDEWPRMQDGKMSDKAWDVYQNLWEASVAIHPNDDRQSNLHQAILGSMQSLGECRRQRAISAANGLSTPLWAAIILGALITIVFTYFFTSQLGPLHFLMTGLIATSLGLNIWLLAEYSRPFSGELAIQPELFKLMQKQVFTTPDTPSRYIDRFTQDKVE